tara:strand:- start:246 stop:671 length:426 start_codon:yes stop_codon:yes gene_type:complete
VKAKIGDKKKFSIIREKKSMIMTLFRFVSFFLEMYKDDKKLRHNIPIKNSLLKNSASKISKLRILNISFVSSLFNNNGAMITVDPFKKNKHSDIKNFFLKEKTVSSFPKWYAATIKKSNSIVFGNINQNIIINDEINTYVK